MKLLLILYAVQAKALEFSMVAMMGVTIGVLEKYHTSCLYILHSTPDYNAIHRDLEHVKTLIKYKHLQIAVVFMKTLLEKNEEKKCNENLPLYLIMSSENSVQKYLNQFSKSSILPRGRWLMFLSRNVQIDSYLVDVDIPYNCEFIVVQNTSKKGLSLTEVYRQQPVQPLQKYDLATWLDTRIKWTNLSLLERRKNLQGVPIRVTIDPKEEPYIMNNCTGFKGEEFCRKYYEIWSIIQKKTNSTSKYVTYTDDVYKADNVNWTKAIGFLVSKQADIGIDPHGLTAERIRVVSYISNAFPTKVSTFIKRQRTGFSKWDDILKPFSTSLWWTISFSLVILPIILTNMWHVTVRFNISPTNEDYSFNNTWILAIACFCQQGQETTPQAWSCRLVFLTAYLTYLILIAAYSAIFISFLAVQHYYVPFSDFQGLLGIGTYRFGTYRAQLYPGMFEFATNPAMRKIYEKLLAHQLDSLPENADDALRMICKENNYAFAMHSDELLQTDPICDVMEIPGASFYMAGSFLISKTCPYYRVFNHNMENLRRFGILAKLNGVFRKSEDNETPDTQATMGDVLSMFIILFAGIFISVLCLAIELILFKYEYRSQIN